MTAPPRQEGVDALVELGFTGLEAEVYASLVEDSPATAYRVAQAIGKAAANVYKAVESLEKRGAILVDDAESRLLRAVPPAELLARFERDFAARRARAKGALERLRKPAAEDDRIYHLRTRDQVIDRATAMIRRAKRLVAVDVFPEPLEEVRAPLLAAARRGVRVVAQLYAPADLPGVATVVAPRAEALREAWPAQWLNVVCDASEHMLSLLRTGGGEVVQAIWSGSAYLSVLYYSGLVAEIEKAALVGRIEEGAGGDALRAELDRWRWLSTSDGQMPGVVALQRRLGAR